MTYLHKDTTSFLAIATSMTRRMRPSHAPTRAWNQRASALPGWWRSHSQASSIAVRRARGLPDLVMPWSRRTVPLCQGLGGEPKVAAHFAPVAEVAEERLVAQHDGEGGTDASQAREPGGGAVLGLRDGLLLGLDLGDHLHHLLGRGPRHGGGGAMCDLGTVLSGQVFA